MDPAGSSRVEEIEALLEADDSLLGRTWKYDRDGLTPQQMAAQEDTATSSWPSNYRTLIRVLRDGEIPNSPTLAEQAARKIRAWLRQKALSDELRRALTEQESLLTSRSADPVAQATEVQDAVERTEEAESLQTPGIYVYTLPHYLRHPYDPESGRTLLKVGHSSVDVYYRAASQGRLTALPEDPILLRVYPCEESPAHERTFHAWLRDADHTGTRTARGGSEWFLTSTKFLDRIAASLHLAIRVVNDLDAGND